MRWAIKHKSGRTLFVTSDEFIANNRRKMGWIVEKVEMTSRERFEKWFNKRSNWKITPSMRKKDGYVGNPSAQSKWEVWKASREEIEIQACQCPNDHGPHVDDYYLEQINNAGLKVKK